MDIEASRAIIFESLDNFELDNAVFHAESLYAEVRYTATANQKTNLDPATLPSCCAVAEDSYLAVCLSSSLWTAPGHDAQWLFVWTLM